MRWSSLFLYRLSDLAVIVTFMLLLVLKDTNTSMDKDYVILSFVGGISFLFMAESGNLYRSWRTSSFREQMFIVCISWLMTSALLFMVLYFSEVYPLFDRSILALWVTITPALLLAWRVTFRTVLAYLRKMGFNTRTAIIIGQTPHGITLANEIQNHTEHGVLFDGFYDERSSDRLPSSEYPIKGAVNQALERAKRGEVDYVYIAMPMHAKERIASILNQFSDTTANTYLIPDFFTYNLLHSRWDQIGQVQTLSVFDTPFAGVSSWIKRFEDILFSSIILVLISPILLAIAIGIKLTSKGPVIFKQHRYGLDGRKIEVWKFRSMTTMDQGPNIKQATKKRPSYYSVWRFSTSHLIRRTAAVYQRITRHYVDRWPSSSCRCAQRRISSDCRPLHVAPQSQTRHYRLGSNQRLSRRNRHAR